LFSGIDVEKMFSINTDLLLDLPKPGPLRGSKEGAHSTGLKGGQH